MLVYVLAIACILRDDPPIIGDAAALDVLRDAHRRNLDLYPHGSMTVVGELEPPDRAEGYKSLAKVVWDGAATRIEFSRKFPEEIRLKRPRQALETHWCKRCESHDAGIITRTD